MQLPLKEKYGDVFTIYLGSRPFVVVTGYDAVKEVYVDRGDDFLARGDLLLLDTLYNNYGVVFTADVERWRELRRFSMATLRNLGAGKRKTEDYVLEETQFLVDELNKNKGSFFNPQHLMSKVSGNIIHLIMFGNRQGYDDKEFNSMLHCIQEILFLFSTGSGQLLGMFPRIMYFLPGKHQKVISSLEELLKYVKRKLEINRKMLDKNNPRSYVDAFLIKMEEDRKQQTEYSLPNLECSTLQIFMAGVETTSATLTYALLILMKYPNVLAKVCSEIDHVIGHDRIPKVQDQYQMPYTTAVLHEIHRFTDILPMGVPRKTTKGLEFRGYFLPKGTNVYPLLTSVLKDPTCFLYPNEFNPENFLDEYGEFKKNPAFMPFGAGKRNCMGETLSRMEIFIVLITILQNFKLKSEVPGEDLDINPKASGFGNIPKPFKISFIPR
ncbi:cytochrome P450 2G1-like isoform X2 [Hyperolius riggenbachi]|uniref:cytochrome P450 2G1-like isoform X2 n=1 Tax=Hyperolius riggenbachi TaxID=752182 RepID=UPI0035A294B0